MSASTDSSPSHAMPPGKRQFSLRFIFAVVTASAVAAAFLRWFGPRDIWDGVWIAFAMLILVVQTAAVVMNVRQSDAARPAVAAGIILGAGIAAGAVDGESLDAKWQCYWLAFGATFVAWYAGGLIAAISANTRFIRCALLLALAWTLLLLVISFCLMWLQLGTMGIGP